MLPRPGSCSAACALSIWGLGLGIWNVEPGCSSPAPCDGNDLMFWSPSLASLDEGRMLTVPSVRIHMRRAASPRLQSTFPGGSLLGTIFSASCTCCSARCSEQTWPKGACMQYKGSDRETRGTMKGGKGQCEGRAIENVPGTSGRCAMQAEPLSQDLCGPCQTLLCCSQSCFTFSVGDGESERRLILHTTLHGCNIHPHNMMGSWR